MKNRLIIWQRLISVSGFILIFLGVVSMLMRDLLLFYNIPDYNFQWNLLFPGNDLNYLMLSNGFFSFLILVFVGIYFILIAISLNFKKSNLITYFSYFMFIYFLVLYLIFVIYSKKQTIKGFVDGYIIIIIGIPLIAFCILSIIKIIILSKSDWSKKNKNSYLVTSIILIICISIISLSLKSLINEKEIFFIKTKMKNTYKQCLDSLELGMSKIEVINLLGTPSYIHTSNDVSKKISDKCLLSDNSWVYKYNFDRRRLIPFERKLLKFENNILVKIE